MEKTKWLQDYQRIKRNPIFFIEEYYNKLYSDDKICLTDEEKQSVYDKYRVKMIPLIDEMTDFGFREYDNYQKKIDALKEKGLKDWEIF